MSHFIALKQRIKIIETIKKTTGAMRLISMSTHSRLNHQRIILDEYTQEIDRILHDLREKAVQTQSIRMPCEVRTELEPVIILVGSQKGLCGTFNENVFHLLTKQKLPATCPLITAGKRASDALKQAGLIPITTFDELKSANFATTASALTTFLLKLNRTNVVIFSNYSRSFFAQKAKMTNLELPQLDTITSPFLQTVEVLHIKTALMHILYESLLAEQAARFLSMDTATRNAEEVLEQTRLEYNKARQTHITMELTELSSSSMAQDD